MAAAFMIEIPRATKAPATDDTPMTGLNAYGRAQALSEALARYLTSHDFAVGDVVVWKPGIKNLMWPRYGEPAVIAEVFSEPNMRMPVDEPSSPLFMAPMHGRIAICHPDDGTLLAYAVDFNRFEPYAPNLDGVDGDRPASGPDAVAGDPDNHDGIAKGAA